MTARKKVSKKLKKSWRKHCDTTDVDLFLENKRLEERLGKSFSDRSNDALFTIDVKPDTGHEPGVMLSASERKKKATEPARCFQITEISIDKPVRSNKFRVSDVKKEHWAKKEALGVFKRKDLLSMEDRRKTVQSGKRKKRNFESRMKLAKAVWTDKVDPIETNKYIDPQWLSQETKDHYLKLTPYRRLNVPGSISHKPNLIPSVQIPHPGLSYNPSLEDHQNLLTLVAQKEEEERKKEEHLNRVTSTMFRRLSRKEVENEWFEEMMQGIEDKIKLEKQDIKDEPLDSSEYSPVNPPVDGEKQRSLSARRKEREEKKYQKELKAAKMEKKKLADIYKLRFISQDIDKFENKIKKTEEKREKKKEAAPYETKRVGRNKYVEEDLDYSLYEDLTGSLRTVQPEGKPFTDRFRSFAQRNILEPTVKQTRKTFTKSKTYIKADHKIPELAKINELQRQEKKKRKNRFKNKK